MWRRRMASRCWLAPASALLVAGITLLTVLALHQLPEAPASGSAGRRVHGGPFQYPVWPEYSPPHRSEAWYNATCFGGQLRPSLLYLERHLELLRVASHEECRVIAEELETLYTIEHREANVTLPPQFLIRVLSSWVKGSQQALKSVKHQRVLHVTNNLRLHEIAFNPARSFRPQLPSTGPTAREQLHALAEATRDSCDFCRWDNMTALVGEPPRRFQSALSAVVGNTLVLDGVHALVLSREHSPLELSVEGRADMVALAERWVSDQQTRRPELRYTALAWDMGQHAGASQVHPHVHVMLSPGRYPAGWERVRRAALLFGEMWPSTSYFSSLVRAHTALGLTARLGTAVALAPVDPILDYELWVIAPKPDRDFQRLFSLSVATVERRLNKLCHSSSLVFPVLGEERDGRMPAMARLVPRGDCTSIRTDFSAIEMFTLSSISIDPYDVIRELRQMINSEGEAPPRPNMR